MGLIVYSELVADISGKIGGGVFAKNKGGAYIRQWAKPTNPASIPQVQQRNILAANAQAWRALTNTQRAGWDALAKQLPLSNKVGKKHTLSGIAMYTRLNNNLNKVDEASISDAPATTAVDAIIALSPSPSATAGTFSIAFGPSPLSANQKILLEATPQYSPGITFVKNKYRIIGYVDALGTTPFDALGAYNGKFGDLIKDQKLSVRATLIDTDTGFQSLPFTATATVS